MSDEFWLRILRDSAAQLGAIVVLFIVIGIPLILVGYLLLRRMASRHNIHVSVDWQGSDVPPAAQPVRPRRSAPRAHDGFNPRRFLETAYKILMLIVALTFLGGAILAWWVATPANQLLLIAMILFGLALIAFLSIGKYDHQRRQAEGWRDVWEDFTSKIDVATSHADPSVHVLDAKAVATAKRMAADGASLDDICRAMERGFDDWDMARQEAFRRVMKAMLDAQ